MIVEDLECQVDQPNGDEFSLHLEVYRQPNTAHYAVVCHGLLCSTRSKIIESIRDNILSRCKDYSVCLFDFRGNGKSGGSTAYGNYEEEAEDVSAVIGYIQSKLKGSVELIIGHSKAASSILIYANKYKYNGILCMLSGRFDMKNQPTTRFSEDQMKQLSEYGQFEWKKYKRAGKECVYVVTKTELERRMNMEMEKYTKNLECRVYIFHGNVDNTVPVVDAYQYHKLISNSKLCILENVDHFYTTSESISAVMDRLLQ